MDYTEVGAESSRAPSPFSLSKREEEYLEAMYILEKKFGRIRIKDLAKMLGVKPPSVVEFLEKLAEKGLVVYRKHYGVELTSRGRKLAERVYQRHIIIKKFLVLLGVPEDKAERDACYIEHGLSEDSFRAIKSFVEFIEGCPDTPVFIKHYHYYRVRGKHPPECPHRRGYSDAKHQHREGLPCDNSCGVCKVIAEKES